MRFLIFLATLVAIGLGYLALNPEVTADLVEEWTREDSGFDGDAWLADARAGVEAGNPWWEVHYGNMLLFGSDQMYEYEGERIAKDPERARELMMRAADKGLTIGLYMAWVFTGRNDEALLDMGLELGDPTVIEQVLTRWLVEAECDTDGMVMLPGDVPSRDALARNREQFVALSRSPERPEFWDEQATDRQLARYDEVDDFLRRAEAGLECLDADGA